MDNVNPIGREMVQEMVKKQGQQMPGSGQANPIGREMVRKMIMKW